MQPISQITLVCALILSTLITSRGAEEHWLADSTAPEILSLETTNTTRTISADLNPWSVEYGAQNDEIYWSDIGSGTIHRISFGLPTTNMIYSAANGVIRGLTLDADRNTLYFLNSQDSTNGTLNALNLITTSNTVLMSHFIRPNDMVLDPEQGNLYITDSGRNEVGVYSINNQTYNILLSSNVVDGAWGIDLLSQENLLFISDFHSNVILRAELDGSNPSVIVANQPTPRGLCVNRHNQRIYWLEADSGTLYSAGLDGDDLQAERTGFSANARDLFTMEGNDRDDDFLNDDWERFYFGNLSQKGTDDSDGDQIDNFTELAFGSSPIDSDQQPAVSIAQSTNGPVLRYTFRNDEWMKYRVVQTENLVEGDWQPVVQEIELEAVPQGSNRMDRAVLIDSSIDNLSSNHFFRVETFM